MLDKGLSRREMGAMLAGGVVVAGMAAAATVAGSTPAAAFQGNMEHALEALQAAFSDLQAATPNKGGHRERAMDLIQRAMQQVQEGIDFANAHGGGGGPPPY